MGTALSFATTNVQSLGTRTIVGSFVFILIVLVFYSLLSKGRKIKGAAFLTIVGIISIGTLIMFTLAVDAIVNDGVIL